jgi:hypothetical protein
MFWAEKSGNYGAINKKGEIIIPFKLSSAGNFNEGYAFVFTETEYGIIDAKGTFVMKAPKPYSYGYSSSGTGKETIYSINNKKYNYKGVPIIVAK